MMIALKAASSTSEIAGDVHLARSVRNFILPRIYPASNRVQIEANNGVVTLSGQVGSFYYKQLWLSGAQRVAGVRQVIDEIEVVTTSSDRRQTIHG
jgi:osmotically-inducible protein OsmY